MFVLFFLIWIIFNGQLTSEIAAFGVVIAGVMYWFLCRFLITALGTMFFYAKRRLC